MYMEDLRREKQERRLYNEKYTLPTHIMNERYNHSVLGQRNIRVSNELL